MSARTSFITMPWGKVRYEERGAGFPVVMLHGNGGTLETWTLNIREIASSFKAFALDIPGFGESDRPENFGSIETISDFVLEIMNALGISKAHFIGNSLGGMIALDCASRHGERVDKLVLLATPSGTKEETEKILKILNGWIREEGIPRITKEEGLRITPKLDSRLLALINGNLRMAGESFSLVNKAIVRFDLTGRLRGVRNRAIIIWGDQDGIAPINGAWILSHHLGDAPVHVIKGAGHSPHFDQPRIVNRIILEFLGNRAR
jgi:pimeloyl-ACP methyl ester carboxylesterase